MNSIILYFLVVVIWGSTWIMIKFQIGPVPAELSVSYRFFVASAFMFAWAWIRNLPLKFSIADHVLIALQGLFIFSTNFYLFYLASEYLTTGLIAVIFSMSSALIILLNAVANKKIPPLPVTVGASVGVVGVAVLFWPEISGLSLTEKTASGLILSIGGTLSFSLGSLVSGRIQAKGISVRGSTAWAMLYGATMLFFLALATSSPVAFDTSFTYVSSFMFLAIPGSVIAFACYFSLIGKIGAERAAYATVLFPLVALCISTVFENYLWTPIAIAGVLLTVAGNVLVLQSRK